VKHRISDIPVVSLTAQESCVGKTTQRWCFRDFTVPAGSKPGVVKTFYDLNSHFKVTKSGSRDADFFTGMRCASDDPSMAFRAAEDYMERLDVIDLQVRTPTPPNSEPQTLNPKP